MTIVRVAVLVTVLATAGLARVAADPPPGTRIDAANVADYAHLLSPAWRRWAVR